MIKVGWDYDEPIHPWMTNAHNVTVAAGLITEDTPMPTIWNAAEHYGIDPEVWYEVLNADVLKEEEGTYLAPLDNAVVWQLHRVANAGFENHVVTARGHFGTLGPLIRDLTERHVEQEGLPIVRPVHFAENKVDVVNALGLNYFIDDGAHNFEALYAGCPDTRVYLLDRPWNRRLHVPVGRRLYSIEHYVDRILDTHTAAVGV